MIVEFEILAEEAYEEFLNTLINQKCSTKKCASQCKKKGCYIGGYSELIVNANGALLTLSTGNMWWVRRHDNKTYLGYWGSRYGFPAFFNFWISDTEGTDLLIDGYQARLHRYITSTPPEWNVKWFEKILPIGAKEWPPREKLKAVIYNPYGHPQFAIRKIVEYDRDFASKFYFKKPNPDVEKINAILAETFPEYFDP